MKAKTITFIILTSFTLHANAKGGLGEIFGALIGKSIGNTVGKSLVDTPSIESALTKMADQLNKRLPMTVDKDTRLDNIITGPGRRFTYNYTFVSTTTREINKTYFHQTMQTQLKNSVCANPDMKIFLTNGITIGYLYHAADGVIVDQIDITPKDCGIS